MNDICQESLGIEDEMAFLRRITSFFPRHPNQLNGLNESDAELITMPGSSNLIAITTDMISEEIALGLYNSPYDLGWCSIVVNVSDLCAVGATPQFVLLNQIFASTYSQEFINQVQMGIQDACSKYGVFVLGGDTNFSESASLGGTMIGTFSKGEGPLKRVGARPQETLYASGVLGRGNLNAFLKLQNIKSAFEFKPSPSLKFSKIIAKHASSCIDISDGLLSAINLISQLNSIGVFLDCNIGDIVDPSCLEFSIKYDLSPWIFLAGQLGDYELLFTIPPKNEKEFLEECTINSFRALKIGETTTVRDVWCKDLASALDTKFLTNLLNTSGGNIRAYIESLITYFKTMEK